MTKRRPHIILASSSPSRKAQLKDLGMVFKIVPSNYNEDHYKKSTLAISQIGKKLASAKAQKVLSENPKFKECIVLAGDQIACRKGTIYNKALNFKTAHKTLMALQGKTHILYTSVFMSYKGRQASHTVKNYMKMRKLSVHQISSYILAYPKVMLTAGSYALESGGIALFSSIKSEDHSAIIGFPLIFLVNQLQKWGYPLPFEK